MQINDLVKGGKYNFSSRAPSIWPNVRGATFDGIIGYATASLIAPVAQQHASALSSLPEGTSPNATKLSYAVFISNDVPIVMAVDWINTSTLVLTSETGRTVKIATATPSDDVRIRQILAAGGFVVTSIE